MYTLQGIFLAFFATLALAQQPPPPQPLADWMARQQKAGSAVHLLVELDAAPTPARRAELASRGLRLLETAAPNLFWAALDPASNASARMAGDAHWAARELGVVRAFELDSSEKLSPNLRKPDTPRWARSQLGGQPAVDVDVLYFEGVDASAAAASIQDLGGAVLATQDLFRRIRARLPEGQLSAIAANNWVLHIEEIPAPRRTFTNLLSGQLLKGDIVRAAPYSLSGSGVNVAVIDGGTIYPHPELAGRVTVMDYPYPAAHATHVAGTIAASGLTPALIGLAPQSRLLSYTYDGDIAAKMYYAKSTYSADVVSNSWGEYITEYYGNCNDYGGYGVEEHDIDGVVASSGVSVVFAMGNDRDSPECAIGPRAGFYTTSRPASAKNVIAVGAINSEKAISAFSGSGPARDGRLKPDVVALGVNVLSTVPTAGSAVASGTSMSTPAVSGLVALMAERFRTRLGSVPSAATIKGILLNTATDLGTPGPDYTFGYGLPDAERAVDVIDNRRLQNGTATQDSSRTFQISVPAGLKSLRVLLAWSDAPGTPGTSHALVNDLDLTVQAPGSDTPILPLTLDPSDLSAPAKPAPNHRDNVEQVVVQNPESGSWTVRVNGANLGAESQDFVVTWSFADADEPPCTVTLSPSEMELPPESGETTFAVRQSNSCAPWTASTNSSWLRLSLDGEHASSGVTKVHFDANTGDVRAATITAANQTVLVRQNAPCSLTPIQPGSSAGGTLTTADCLDRYGSFSRRFVLQGKAGQGVRIVLTSTEFLPYLLLTLADGSVLKSGSPESYTSTQVILPSEGQYILPADATYIIEASAYFSADTGAFTLAVELDPAPVIDGGPPVYLAACPAERTGIVGDSSSHLGARGDLYHTERFNIYGRIGAEVTAEVTEATFDTVLYLISSSGTVIAFNDDYNGALSRLRAVLPSSGIWRIELSTFDPQSGGAYRLGINGCSEIPH